MYCKFLQFDLTNIFKYVGCWLKISYGKYPGKQLITCNAYAVVLVGLRVQIEIQFFFNTYEYE